MFLRIFKYLMIMFPPYLNMPVGIIIFFSSYFVIQNLLCEKIEFNLSLLSGGITIMLMMLLLRVMDELKDYEKDKKQNKNRPLITGVVKLNDLKTLMLVITITMLVLNFFLGKYIFISFLFMLIYSYLMFIDFFNPKTSQNLILQLLTHNPIGFIFQIYIISFAYQNYGKVVFQLETLLIAIMFWLPFLAWELGRKIRKPSEETVVETYSKFFGYKLASFLTLFTVITIFFLAIYIVIVAHINFLMILLITPVAIHIIKKILSFIKKPFSLKKGFNKEMQLLLLTLNLGFFIFAIIGY